MPELIKLSWSPNPASGLPRSARRGCDYEAYVPDALTDRSIVLSGTTTAELADAERAIDSLNNKAGGLVDSEAMARLLLRAEAVASSRIEGLEVGGRRLLKEQLARGLGEESSDLGAAEVLNNIDAMRMAVDSLGADGGITIERLLAVHERLLAGTSLGEHGGRIREQQNWIGGSSYNPCSATFVPPPPGRVPGLLDDLCVFCNGDDLPPVVQAALAHAQFETIHPFIDGNGRAGRALIHMILRRRGLARRAVPPVSLILATWSKDYVDGLTATRHRGPSTSDEAILGLDSWIALFSAATTRAVADAETYEQKVTEVQADWRERLASVRSDSATDRLIDALPGAPVITVQSAAALIGRSEQAVNQAIPRLLEARVLKQTTVGRRNRAFEALELIDAFTGLERRLASPESETRHSPPARTVPRGP